MQNYTFSDFFRENKNVKIFSDKSKINDVADHSKENRLLDGKPGMFALQPYYS